MTAAPQQPRVELRLPRLQLAPLELGARPAADQVAVVESRTEPPVSAQPPVVSPVSVGMPTAPSIPVAPPTPVAPAPVAPGPDVVRIAPLARRDGALVFTVAIVVLVLVAALALSLQQSLHGWPPG